ncbi:MAG: Gfo/Idh/MocA family oxidoreductase, partial [Chloroflexia bacterium]|nr:Gfo/Idh/MocA family oxidoreductase [Chloroflexia bacterium]
MPKSPAPVRIAVVGLDHWYSAFSFAEAVAGHAETTLVAIVDADLGRARELAGRVGVDRVTTDRAVMLDDAAVDVVASFVGSDHNPSVVAAAAARGKHLVSVKPVARTLAEATALRATVRAAGVVFLPSESRSRLSEQHRQIKEWVAQGAFGQILSASGAIWASLPERWPGDPDPGWWADAARVPGGGWIDHAIYDVDLLRWLLGEEVARASGVAANLKFPELPVEDFGAALLTFEGGAVANLEVTWTAPPGGGRRTLAIVGSEGALAYDSLTDRLSLAGHLSETGGWSHGAPRAWDAEGIDHVIYDVDLLRWLLGEEVARASGVAA